MKRLGLFGGAFDPIHNGHLTVAQTALSRGLCDEVLFIPCGLSPHKGALKASGGDRLAMVREAVKGKAGLFVSSYEVTKETPCYTYDTVRAMKALYPDDELCFLIGDDEYRLFEHWYRAEELLALCRFYVFTREGVCVKAPFTAVTIEPMAASSSEVRALLQTGRDVSGLVPAGVLAYIKAHGLYR